MLVQEVPNVNTHTHIGKERVTGLHDLLLGITICVIEKVFRLVCTWNREHIFNEVLGCKVSCSLRLQKKKKPGHWKLPQPQRKLCVQR